VFERQTVELDGKTAVTVCFTDARDGDFRVRDPQPGLDAARTAITAEPWSWIVQVHEAEVLTVEHQGHHAGAVADGLLTTSVDCPIAVTTADCAPVVLIAERGVAVVHAGWRGLMAGIVERAGEQLTATAGAPVQAMLGPCIAPEDYEFGSTELDLMADRFGPAARGITRAGTPALDVPAAVAVACERAGWSAPERPPSTSDPRWFSHRTRGDLGRQTAVAWLHKTGDDQS
jgi:copper oxidase (laccase) domain-containing protein